MRAVTIVRDEGPASGLGHLRRTDALASALIARGWQVERRASGRPVAAPTLVVDSYTTRADDTTMYTASTLAAVDDLCRDLDIDLIVDPNPGGERGNRQGRTELLGPRYALVDPTLRTLSGRPPTASVSRLLVTLGAGPAAAAIGQLVREVRSRLGYPVAITVATGPWRSSDLGDDVETIGSSDGLQRQMLEADIVVTSAGVSMLESLALGRPTVATVVADNQQRAAHGAAAAGAVVLAEPGSVADAVDRLARCTELRSRLALGARRYVDGHGAERVASALESVAC